MTVDQTLFALSRLLQWKWPNEFRESTMVVMMGGLHNWNGVIENAKQRNDFFFWKGSGVRCIAVWRYLYRKREISEAPRCDNIKWSQMVWVCWLHCWQSKEKTLLYQKVEKSRIIRERTCSYIFKLDKTNLWIRLPGMVHLTIERTEQ